MRYDPLLMRYENKNHKTESISCAATSLDRNLVAIGDRETVYVHEMSSGFLLYQLKHSFPWLAFAKNDSKLLIVDSNGVNIYDAMTGKLNCQSERELKDEGD